MKSCENARNKCISRCKLLAKNSLWSFTMNAESMVEVELLCRMSYGGVFFKENLADKVMRQVDTLIPTNFGVAFRQIQDGERERAKENNFLPGVESGNWVHQSRASPFASGFSSQAGHRSSDSSQNKSRKPLSADHFSFFLQVPEC